MKEYKILKNITLGFYTFYEGDVVSEDEAKRNGLDVWYKKTKGKNHVGKVVKMVVSEDEVVKENLSVELGKDVDDLVVEGEKRLSDDLAKKIAKKGFTVADVMNMGWRELLKNFGVDTAAKIKRELKQNDKSN